MSRKSNCRNEYGFSLVELLVVIALIGILTTLSIPSLRTFYYGYQIKETAQRLSMIVQKARLRAINTRSPVTLAFSKTGDTISVVMQEGVLGSGVFNGEQLTFDGRARVLIGWNSGGAMTNFAISFQPDGAVTNDSGNAAWNNPPRIDIYDQFHATIVSPAYLRISLRGSTILGNLNINPDLAGHTTFNSTGYYVVSNTVSHLEELRRGVRIATTE